MTAPWKPDGAPFCWQPKAALRTIEENVENPGSAILVYLALTRIASNEESATFTKPLGYVAKLATLSRRTCQDRLRDLARLELITITHRQIDGTKAHDANVYTLRQPLHKVRQPLPNLRQSKSPHDCPLIEEQKKEKKYSKPRNVPERIAAEGKLKILKDRLKVLKEDTAEAWQRQEHPELVEERNSLATEIKSLEDSLLC